MSNLAVQEKGAIAASFGLDYTNQELLKTIKETIAFDATDAEFKMFIELCKGTGLNPFKKEIWFIKTKGKKYKDQQTGEWKQTADKVQMMTGINGFYAIANSHPQYDGMEETIIEREGNRIIRATAKVWRKDRKFPSVGVAEWSEYYQSTQSGKGIWDTKPSVMISKVAESLALRKAFPNELNGLYTSEEMPANYDINSKEKEETEPINVTPQKAALPPQPVYYQINEITDEQVEFLEKAGCVYIPETNLWMCEREVAKALAIYKVDYRSQKEKMDEIFGDDDIEGL